MSDAKQLKLLAERFAGARVQAELAYMNDGPASQRKRLDEADKAAWTALSKAIEETCAVKPLTADEVRAAMASVGALVSHEDAARVAEQLAGRAVAALTANEILVVQELLGELADPDWNDPDAAPDSATVTLAALLDRLLLASAFDSASRSITGRPAGSLSAALDSEVERHPDPGHEPEHFEPTTSLGDWDVPSDQITSPAPLRTMAEVQRDGGPRPHTQGPAEQRPDRDGGDQ